MSNVVIMSNVVTWIIVGIIIMLFLFRNVKVKNYRLSLLHHIDVISKKEIQDGNLDNWEERYKIYSQISYEKMLYSFWKPLNKFYDQKNFNWPDLN